MSVRDIVQAAAGAGGGGVGSYLAVAGNSSPYFTLLDHTTPGTLTLATTYNLGGRCEGVDFSPDGNYIACAVGLSDNVSGFLTLLNHSAGTVSLAATYSIPYGLRTRFAPPNGDYIVVTAATGGVTLLDHTTPGTLSFSATGTGTGRPGSQLSFSSNGNYLGVPATSGFNLLNHTTPGSLSLATSYNLGTANNGVTLSPDEGYVACGTSSATGRVVLLSRPTAATVSYSAIYNLSGTETAFALNFSNDSSYIAVPNASSPYFTLLNHSGGSLSLATTYTLGGTARVAKFSPDDLYIAIGRQSDGTITLLNHASGTVSLAATYSAASECFDLSFSPN